MRNLLLFMLLVSAVGGWTRGGERPLRPNFLLIVADDQGREAGCYGTSGVATPNLDYLAATGRIFRQAFSAYPSCSPSRASILTGVYPHNHGITINVPEFFGPEPPATLRDGYLARYANRGLKVSATLPTLPELLNQAGYRTAITRKFHILPHTKFPFHEWLSGSPADLKAFFAARQPFFVMHNIIAPHRPFAEHLKRLQGQPVNLERVQVPACLPDAPAVRQDWADYLSSVQVVDEDLGVALQALRESGQFNNTIILHIGDNGPAFQRGKASTYPLGLRTPLLVAGPGIPRSGNRRPGESGRPAADHPGLRRCDPSQHTRWAARCVPFWKAGLGPSVTNWWWAKSMGGPKPGSFQERGATDGRWHYIRRHNMTRGRAINLDDFDEKVWGNRTYPATLSLRETFPLPYQLLTSWKDRPPAEELYEDPIGPGLHLRLAPRPGLRRPIAVDAGRAGSLAGPHT